MLLSTETIFLGHLLLIYFQDFRLGGLKSRDTRVTQFGPQIIT